MATRLRLQVDAAQEIAVGDCDSPLAFSAGAFGSVATRGDGEAVGEGLDFFQGGLEVRASARR